MLTAHDLHDRRLVLLQRMPVFGALREDTLDFLLSATRERQVAAGVATSSGRASGRSRCSCWSPAG
jgi:hypothetical protein